MLCFAAAFYATIVWMRRVQDGRDAPRYLGFAGAAAGLCLAAKHNLGVFCLGAVLLSILIVSGHRRIAARRAGLVITAFVLIGAAILLPIIVTGGFDRFVVYAVLKATYLQTATVPYSAVVDRFTTVMSGPWSVGALAAGYRELLFLLPFAVFALLAVVCLRVHRAERQTALVVTTFVVAGYLVVFPQPGGSSIMFATPDARGRPGVRVGQDRLARRPADREGSSGSGVSPVPHPDRFSRRAGGACGLVGGLRHVRDSAFSRPPGARRGACRPDRPDQHCYPNSRQVSLCT